MRWRSPWSPMPGSGSSAWQYRRIRTQPQLSDEAEICRGGNAPGRQVDAQDVFVGSPVQHREPVECFGHFGLGEDSCASSVRQRPVLEGADRGSPGRA